MNAAGSTSRLNRSDAEDWLYHEAELLDQWKLEEWLELFTATGEYFIPGGLEDDGSKRVAALIKDDRNRLNERVWRLVKGPAHAQIPRSQTRRLISNVRVEAAGAGATVTSNFLIHEIRKQDERILTGQYIHVLELEDDMWRVARRTARLQNSILPLFNVSIVI